MPEDDPTSAAPGAAGSSADLMRRLDTVAGAVASIATSHTDLRAHVAEAEARRTADAREVAQRLDGLEQALLAVPVASRRASGYGPAPYPIELDELRADIGLRMEVLARVAQVVERLDERDNQPAATADAPTGPGLAPEALAQTAEELSQRLTLHTDTALAGVVRVIDGRLDVLRAELRGELADIGQRNAPAAQPAGFEAGAVMGAAQAAWNRLEQRLDTEFDDLSRRLDALDRVVESAALHAEAAASRPVVSGEQLRRAASTMKTTVLDAGRARWARYNDRSLGSGR